MDDILKSAKGPKNPLSRSQNVQKHLLCIENRSGKNDSNLADKGISTGHGQGRGFSDRVLLKKPLFL
jgi:hypothetical protein